MIWNVQEISSDQIKCLIISPSVYEKIIESEKLFIQHVLYIQQDIPKGGFWIDSIWIWWAKGFFFWENNKLHVLMAEK